MEKGNPTQQSVEKFINECPIIRNMPDMKKEKLMNEILQLIGPYQELKK